MCKYSTNAPTHTSTSQTNKHAPNSCLQSYGDYNDENFIQQLHDVEHRTEIKLEELFRVPRRDFCKVCWRKGIKTRRCVDAWGMQGSRAESKWRGRQRPIKIQKKSERVAPSKHTRTHIHTRTGTHTHTHAQNTHLAYIPTRTYHAYTHTHMHTKKITTSTRARTQQTTTRVVPAHIKHICHCVAYF